MGSQSSIDRIQSIRSKFAARNYADDSRKLNKPDGKEIEAENLQLLALSEKQYPCHVADNCPTTRRTGHDKEHR